MINILQEIPKSLQTIKSPVKNLFYSGNLELLKCQKIAIVGSRKALPYTKQIVAQLSQKLSNAGVVVVSGGAMGIDGVAHKSSYPNTIAVMANGLDIIYPKVNTDIISKIYNESGLALSEYKEGIKATRYSFVVRNRIVVALSDSILIAQADLKSGTMRSAEIAIEQGKKIYVLPHRIGDSSGTQWLIKENKAEIIYDIEEFIFMFSGAKSEKITDPFLLFCLKNPDYEDIIAFDSVKLFEYELLGKIEVKDTKVVVL
jgi:DNA processing protein